MLEPFNGRGVSRRRNLGPARGLALAVFAALLLGACSSPDALDAAGADFDVVFRTEDGGELQTGSLEGATVDGTFTIVVEARRGAVSASFYLDDRRMQGSPFVVDDSAPFTAEVSTDELEPGQHTVTVAVFTSRHSRPKVKTVTFTVADEAEEPTDPEPTDPSEPTDPEPTDPTDPTDPSDPTDPTDPSDPTDPTDPDEPTDPEPTDPEPTDPEPTDPDPTPEPPDADYPEPTYWVATYGSDSNDGRTAETAFRTIRKAASVVRPGDVVYIRGGVYKEYLTADRWPTSGQEGRPITIMGAPGETAILDGSDKKNGGTNPSAPQLIWLRDRHWYVFQNLTLRYSAGRGIELEGDHHVVRNVISHGNHGDGIYVEGDYNLVEDSYSYDNYSYTNGGDSADGVKVSFGTGNVLRRVVVYENSDDGIDLWDSTNGLVEYCVSYRNGRGTTGNGQGFKLSNGGRADSGNVIRYNVSFSNRAYNFTDNGGGGLTLYNNTSFDAGIKGYVARGRYGQARSELYNNISYDEGSPLLDSESGSTKPLHERNSWNLSIGDPEFASTNPDSSQFLHLASGSDAIDKGKYLGQEYYGAAPDLGAYEYGLPAIVAGAY